VLREFDQPIELTRLDEIPAAEPRTAVGDITLAPAQRRAFRLELEVGRQRLSRSSLLGGIPASRRLLAGRAPSLRFAHSDRRIVCTY